MARKTEFVSIPADYGRDVGKMFLLTEMPASKAETWATRAILAVTRAGIDLDVDPGSGMSGVMAAGVQSVVRGLGGISMEDVQPLLDEMMTCIQAIPDPAAPNVARYLVEDDIEEVRTRLYLRERVLSLHVGFSIAGRLSNSLPSAEPETV